MSPTGAEEGSVNLGAVPGGAEVQILAVKGGQGLRSRLACLGFLPGAHLRVIQNSWRGPMLVAVCDTRVALGRGEASKILVERLARNSNG